MGVKYQEFVTLAYFGRLDFLALKSFLINKKPRVVTAFSAAPWTCGRTYRFDQVWWLRYQKKAGKLAGVTGGAAS